MSRAPRTRRVLVVLWALALAATTASVARPSASRTAPPEIVVLVNDSVPAHQLSRSAARRIFLLQTRFWANGMRIAPVNLPAGSSLREAFSRSVLGAGTRDLVGYWNALYFHGTLPPPTLESEQAVLRYVRTTPGAIGYVSAAAADSATLGLRPVLRVAY